MSLFNIYKKVNEKAENLEKLMQIVRDGYPNHICTVVPLLKDNHREVREMAADVIAYLFMKIDSKNQFNSMFRYCKISVDDIDYYKRNFPKDILVKLLAISSFNQSGYVRQKAVKQLAGTAHPHAIPFIIYRLSDWVKAVRLEANQGLERFKTKSFIDALIQNIDAFEDLQKIGRVNLNDTYKSIVDFIVNDHREHILIHYKEYPDKLRLKLAKLMQKSLSDDYQELRFWVRDGSYLVRGLTLEHFDKLTSNEIQRLLNDKSGRVRLQALPLLKDRADFRLILQDFIADNSSMIRYYARFILKTENIDFAEIYYQNLIEDKNVGASLLGLAEVNASVYKNTIVRFLNNPKVNVQRAAFRALVKLDEEAAYTYGLENLNSDIPVIRKTVIPFLSKKSTDEVLDKARYSFNMGTPKVKMSMLNLFSDIGGWKILPDLVLGTIDDDEAIRNMSAELIRIWKLRAIHLFVSPQKEDKERARQVLLLANEIHQDKKYFNRNPLDELDFYFR